MPTAYAMSSLSSSLGIRWSSLFSLVLVPGLAAAQLSLRIAADHPIIAVDEDFEVTATVSNVSGLQGWIDFGDYDTDYEIDLRDAAGKNVPESAYSRRLKSSIIIGGARLVQFPPDGVRSEKIDIAKFFDLPGPGAYTVQLSRLDLHSNVLIVTVLPGITQADGRSAKPVAPIAAIPSSGAGGENFRLHIEVDRVSVVAGKEIPVYTVLTNLSDGKVSIPVPYWVDSNAGIEVRNADGGTVADTDYSRLKKKAQAQQGEAVHRRTLTAKMQLQGRVDIAQYVDLSAPGIYFVQLFWKVPADLGGGEVRSNVVQITVRPKGSR
jgi:hypothetical protein